MKSDSGKLVFTFREAWQVSGLGRDFLLNAIHDGRLRTIRAGRRFLIPRNELERFIQQEAR